MRCCLMLSLMMTIGAALLSVIAIGLPYWQYASSPDEKYQGLWTSCSTRKDECKLILMAPEALDATRVMMFFGLILYVLAALFTFVFMVFKQEKTGLVNGALVFTTLGGIFTMIAVIVYGAKYNYLLDSQGTSLYVAFGIAVVSAIMGFVCTLMFCMAKARDEID